MTRAARARAYAATLLALLRLLWHAGPLLMVVTLALSLALGTLPVLVIVATSAILERLAGATPGTTGITGDLLILLLALALANVLTTVTERVSTALHQLQTTRVTNHIQLTVARRAAATPFHRFEDRTFHNRMQTTMAQALQRPMMLLDQATGAMSSLVTVASLGGALLVWNPLVLGVLVAASLVGLRLSTAIAGRRVRMVVDRAELERQKHYLTEVLTDERAAKEIRSTGIAGHLLQRLEALMARTYEQDRALVRREVVLWASAGAGLALVQPALLGYAAVQALSGAIGIGRFNLYAQAIMQIDRQLTRLAATTGLMHEGHLYARELLAFLRDTEDTEDTEDIEETADRAGTAGSPGGGVLPAPACAGGPPGPPGLDVEDVWFTYPGTTAPVLRGLSLSLAPGEVVALVGHNGAGKTTLVKLLLGLYAPDHGRIRVGGTDLAELDAAHRRGLFAAILQDFTIYHFTARENVWLGDVGRPVDDAALQAAVRDSGLAGVVDALPHGEDTVLGKFWHRGHELSGGQRQLVALARGLYRSAPVLILDEPSAALDPEAERHFFDQAVRGSAGTPRTTLLISHRISTVRQAERIAVLDGGRVVEQGLHDDLMRSGGLFAELYRDG